MNARMIVVCVIVVLMVSSCGLLVRGCGYYEYSEGSRSGVISKFSKKGIIWKTWEGEMVLGGLRSTADGAVANVWHFSLDRVKAHNEDVGALAKQINAAKDSGKRIRLEYKQSIISLPWRSKTSYYIQSIDAYETP
jgi:hypothetical protein